MPRYNFKCPVCNSEKKVIQSYESQPPMCEMCADIPMVKDFKTAVYTEVPGGYDERLGKKAWKVHNDDVAQASILLGDTDPY